MAGRRTKLTPELQKTLCMVLGAGNYIETACAHVGLGLSTFYRWMERGEKANTGIYKEFWEAVQKARASAIVRNVALIQQAAQENWQAAAWWLERSQPDKWGRRVSQVEMSGPNGQPIAVQVSEEDREELKARIVKYGADAAAPREDDTDDADAVG